MHSHPHGAAIRADGLQRRFNGNTAVEHLDLEIEAGEIYGFLGPNGAGKTTTVRMLCTLLAPTGGHAIGCRLRRRVGSGIGAFAHRCRVARRVVRSQADRVGAVAVAGLVVRAVGAASTSASSSSRSSSISATRSTAASRRTRAACNAGSIWPPRSCTTPTCCSSTSPRPASTR